MKRQNPPRKTWGDEKEEFRGQGSYTAKKDVGGKDKEEEGIKPGHSEMAARHSEIIPGHYEMNPGH